MDYQQKQLFVFDLDGTLTPSKSTMPPEMVTVFVRLLEHHEVGIISGGSFTRFEQQCIRQLPSGARLQGLTLLPTCGSQRYENIGGQWCQTFIDELSVEEKERIVAVLQEAITQFGYDSVEHYGELLDDRGSQVTYSALGQDIAEVLGAEGLARKAAWDPDDSKKLQVQAYAAARLPDFEVRISSPTSIDISRPGMDKAYGVRELMQLKDKQAAEVLFVGDRLQAGGNDYPVKTLGVECVPVQNWQDTLQIIQGILEAETTKE